MEASQISAKPLECLLLGEEPLAQRCADLLLERGHRIIGIVTRAQPLIDWAIDHDIPVLGRKQYPGVIKDRKLDALFSITHPALISPEVINQANVVAVNYHDGPLPRYAGMNGSAWALHNGEAAHALVWHHLTAGLDAGDILERRDVTVDPRETSLSLNMKNSALALESFEVLLGRIELGQLAGTPQRTDIERTVFSRHDRPPALCVLDWQQDATALDCLVRACDFGRFPNRFGTPKAVHRGAGVLVLEVEPTNQGSTNRQPTTNRHGAAPGTVLAVEDSGIVVACGSGALRIKRCASLTGQSLTVQQAAEALAISKGSRLHTEHREAYTELSPQVARAEPFFLARLGNRNVPMLPFRQATSPNVVVVGVPLPDEFRGAFEGSLPDATAALFCFVLSCLLREDSFTVSLTSTELQDSRRVPVMAQAMPFDISILTDSGFGAFAEGFARDRQELSKRPGFVLDLIARHPELASQPELRGASLSSVALVYGDGALPAGARLGLVVSEQATSYLITDGSIALAEVRQLQRRLLNVAAAAARDRERPLREVDCLDDAERNRHLGEWNATAREYPTELRIMDLFEQAVDRAPDALALIFEGQRMTFREVEQAANRLANVLQRAGAGPGEYVGLLVERCFNLVIALLGIAKSGAAYLPVDTIYPADRGHFMLEDAGCRFVVASASLVERCGARRVIVVDGDEVRGAPADRPTCPARSTDVCYAIFTSGSTGKPKGVVLTHRAVINTLDWVNRTFEVTPADRLLFVTSPSFDLSVYDVFGALGAGATVEIASNELLAEPEAMVRHLCEEGITIWDSAPPALARLAPFFPDDAPDSKLRLVMMSGDWIPVGLPDHLRQVFDGVSVKSLGGATEAAIWSNYCHIADVDPAWTSIPYGYPIQNARYYILDHHLRPVPAEITGDLYIGGDCLAQGYLNRPELTADRFVADPFLPGQRIYKTGDLARFWRDGTMEFLGRADFQVKIRGFRVEMGEVESALAAQPGVRDALCVAHEDASGHKALVAYLVPKGGAQLDPQLMREALAVKLPDFMVPSHVLVLDHFPLSANGKVDRKALPSPDQVQARTEYVAPVTSMQIKLTEIWQSAMKREKIGIDDNFFELGGHSLMAVSVVTQIKDSMGISVALSKIIECPTIHTLALALGDVEPTDHQVKATPASVGQHTQRPLSQRTVSVLRPGGPQTFFFIYDGHGETLLYMNLAGRLPPEYAAYGVLPRTQPGIPLAHETIEDMAAYAIEQMRSIQPDGPYNLGGLCAGGTIGFEIAAQLERAGERVDALVLLEAFEPTATPRRGIMAQGRIDRFRRVFNPDGANGRSGASMAREAISKIGGAARYEVSSRMVELTVPPRLKLLHRILRAGGEWPIMVPPLTIHDIYVAARDRYRAGTLACSNVILVKATEAQPGVHADELMRQLYLEELLGWEGHVPEGIKVLNVAGGHSTMLREPFVDDLAEKLAAVLQSEEPLAPSGRTRAEHRGAPNPHAPA